MSSRKPNRLINEKSPYLRQHAYNPVDWYPWSEEAFEKAKKEDKPIFLSIGYSTCHWCHVMEKESFEDEEIAEILNKYYVPIKVDREERPDIDAFYMTVCQAMTGSGGWPLTIIMTPDKEPFFAGTYFPKESYFGRPGLKDILLKIAELWEKDRKRVLSTAKQLVKSIEEATKEKAHGNLSEDTLHRAFGELYVNFDHTYGGFGNAPKFPIPHNFMFLGRYYYRYKREEAKKMIEKTLTMMRMGGIYDQVGFGFHRYSTDREWLLPHFEKMLYDQALLLIAYTEAYQLTKNELFKRTVEEIVDFLKRDMLSPEGAFYSAWDADSEGEEGKFYTWTYRELKDVLDEEEFKFLEKYFNIKEEGNYLEEATKTRTGRNILYIGKNYEEALKDKNFFEEFEKIRRKLLEVRKRRVKPLRDEKILTDWNGLTIAGLSYAGKVLGNEEFIKLAHNCAKFILKNMKKDGKLMHRYMEGEVSIPGFLEDYAFLIWGLLELYEATMNSDYLIEAKELQDIQNKYFLDEEGGFYQTPEFFTDIPVRKKEIYDGAIPSGNSVSFYNLLRLGRMLGLKDYENIALKGLESFSWDISNFPSAHTFSLISLDLKVNGSREIVIVPKEEGWKEYKEELDKFYIPDTLIVLNDEKAKTLSDYFKNFPKNEKTSYYICENYACRNPIYEGKRLIEEVRGKSV